MASDLGAAMARLQAHLQRTDAPIAPYLRPGVSADRARARVLGATGLPLPAQAAEWSAWHNGVAQHDPALAPHALYRWVLLDLDSAISQYHLLTRTAGKIAPPVPEVEVETEVEAWNVRWLPLATDHGGTPLMVVGGGDRNGQIDVLYYDEPDLVGHNYPSLVWVVEAWAGLLEEGLWQYDRDTGRWTRDTDRLRDDPRFGLS